MTDYRCVATVGDTFVDVLQCDITGGAFGSVGSAVIRCGLSMLLAHKVDVYEITTSAAGITPVAIYAGQGTQGADGSTMLFGGEYLDTEWDLDGDTLTIHARDWAGPMVDQKRVMASVGKATTALLAPLAPGKTLSASTVSNENQTVAQIVTALATEFGLTPVLNLTGGNNPTVGALFGGDATAWMPTPRSVWEMLNQIARDTGYDVYVTPSKELVFGLPGAGLPTIPLSYNLNPPLKGTLPSRGVKVKHQPRRNSTFRVLVISYDPSKKQTTLGRATCVGANLATKGAASAGIHTASDAVAADAGLAKAGGAHGVSVAQVALYTFHVDGLTQDQATAKAASIASDISKREIIVSGTIPPLLVKPTQMVTLVGNTVPPFVSGVPFYISGFSHHFRLPKDGERGHHTGLTTRFTALNIPTEALAKETSG